MKKEAVGVRLRIITVKSEKVLLTYDSEGDFFFYVGGRLEYGETIEEGAKREIREECGEDTTFAISKILYIRDFMLLVEGILINLKNLREEKTLNSEIEIS